MIVFFLAPSLFLGCREAQVAAEKVRRAVVSVKEEATTPAFPCDSVVSTDAPTGCLSGTLQCGDVIEGTTVGGDSNWNDDFYAGIFCFPAGDDRSGPERVYRFQAPANQDITIKLQSDCVDLDLAVLAWEYGGSCPGVNHLIPECGGENRTGGDVARINTFKPREYLVAVEGKRAKAGPYRLTVTCAPLAGR
ncbi:MAG: hypothetical protein Q8P18_02345 [Pseudomonadota bacterium]|nr:hypothetical protein [Pseudomonadota bacterium]